MGTLSSLRSRELRAGGRLVVSVPAANDDDVSGFEDIMDHANAVLAEMVGEGAVTQNERARMVIGAWPRRRRDLLAPFARGGKFMELKVEHCETNSLPDAAWANYQRGGDKDALATRTRSSSEPYSRRRSPAHSREGASPSGGAPSATGWKSV